MNSVGIDISKGRSTVAVMRPFGEVVISPFEVRHTVSELSELARRLKESLSGIIRTVLILPCPLVGRRFKFETLSGLV